MPSPRVIENKPAKKRRRKARKQLLSHSSILIFSGFLIGMVFNRMAGSGIEIYVFSAGLIGLLGYLFSAGAPPPPPFATCGFDPTDGDNLECSTYAPCN